MISPMVHFTFAVFYAQYEKFLEDIQEMGIVHVKEREVGPFQKELSELQDDYYAVSTVLKDMLKRKVQIRVSKSTLSWEKILEEYNSCKKTGLDLSKKKEDLELLEDQIRPWGEYSLDAIARLRKSGIQIHFFKVKEKDFDESWLEKYPLEIVSNYKSEIYFVYFGEKSRDFHKAEELDCPTIEWTAVGKSLAELKNKISQNEEKLNALAESGTSVLNKKSQELGTRIKYLEVLNDHTAAIGEGKVKVLEGWVPESEQQLIIDYLDLNGILYTSHYATLDSHPPVKLANSQFGSLFEPIGKLFSLPAYKEIDLTIYFAPFFLLFFGFCLGDGGYGILIFLAATFYKRKASVKLKPYLSLAQYFGLSTLVMGIIFGNFFGIELGKVAFLSPFKSYFLDSNKVFYLSLILGGIQILFGLCLKIANQIKQNGILYGLGTIGWLILILNLLTFALLKKTGTPASAVSKLLGNGISVISILLILFFTEPGAKIHLRFASGLWSIYSTVTGIFGDMLSYIRLFALGISSSILGLVVNQMALSFLGIKVIGPILFLLVAVLGHLGNLVISSLGSFVHPLRLTLVEFYKNAGFSGGGKEYNPFSKIKPIKY